MTPQLSPMAFFHEDGTVPSWNFASWYASPEGHVATLPEIIEGRMATKPGDFPWHYFFTSSSAEYYGVGADGKYKLIIAHGIGPMSTLQGIKDAYKWEYGDKSRRNNGGRIPAEEFLKLEAGEYGSTFDPFNSYSGRRGHVIIIDFEEYLGHWDDAFYGWRRPHEARSDMLLWARFGVQTGDYVSLHKKYALEWHKSEGIKLPDGGQPYLIQVDGAPNCPYTTSPMVDGRFDWTKIIPRPLEDGLAMAHLLSLSGLTHMHCGGWQGLTCDVGCFEWWNSVRFVGVPEGATWENGIVEGPVAHKIVRQQWQRFLLPNTDPNYVPPRLFRLEKVGEEWLTHYPKQPDVSSMDSGDLEFHVKSVTPIGIERQFKVDEDFFLRYDLSQVLAIMPEGANAYEFVDVSRPDSKGITTVTVQFYNAWVDLSKRLPRSDDIKQDYDLLMG